MKKLNKLCALILAILIVASVIPVALATNFDADAYADAYIKASSYAFNIYASDEKSTSSEKTLANILYLTSATLPVFNAYPELENAETDIEKLKTMPEAAAAFTAVLQELVTFFESEIASGELVIQVSTEEFYNTIYRLYFTYGKDKVEEVVNKAPENIVDNAANSMAKAVSMPLAENAHTYTQEDFDAEASYAMAYWKLVELCLSGKHYISYSVATNNGDGTHSFICDFCDEPATVNHKYSEGKCVCGDIETSVDNGTTDSEEQTDDDNEEPENTNFLKKLRNKISEFLNKLKEFFNSLFSFNK